MTGCRELYVGIKNGKIKCKEGAWPQVKRHIEFMDEYFPNWLDDDKSFAKAKFKEKSSRLVRSLEKTNPDIVECVIESVLEEPDRPTAKRIKEIIYQKKVENITPRTEEREDVRIADIRDIILSDVDLILTDPPYPEQYLPLWKILFQKSLEGLKEGGFLVTYTPHIYIPDIFEMVSKGLNYVWTIAQIHTGAKTTYHPSRVNIGWKPIFVFVKGKMPDIKYFNDVIMGQGREKDAHEWQQALGESEALIKAFCSENGLVVDPFVGSGTTALAARNTGRNFLVFDNDPVAIETTLRRLNNE